MWRGNPSDGYAEGMKSRVHPTYKTKYRVENWDSYDRALVRRGDVTLWVSPAAVATWAPAGVGTRGGQRKYSDLAIETALTLRLIFHLPLRHTEGFLTSLFGMMGLGLSAPDHTTLSQRGQSLDVMLRRIPPNDPIHLIVDRVLAPLTVGNVTLRRYDAVNYSLNSACNLCWVQNVA